MRISFWRYFRHWKWSFDEIFVTGCNDSCQKWQPPIQRVPKIRQNDNSASVATSGVDSQENVGLNDDISMLVF